MFSSSEYTSEDFDESNFLGEVWRITNQVHKKQFEERCTTFETVCYSKQSWIHRFTPVFIIRYLLSQYHHCGLTLHLRPPDDVPPPWSRHYRGHYMSQVSRVTLVALSDHFPVKPLLSLLGPSQPGRPERASSPLATSSHHGVISCQERRHIHSDGCPHSVLSAVDLLLPMTSYYCQRIGCHTTQGPSHNVS